MKKILVLVFSLFLFWGLADAQISISIHDITVQNQDSISVPIYVSNFNGVGAISLAISYDPNMLAFTGSSNNPTTGNFIENAVNSQIRISWFDISPLNIGNGILLNLNFKSVSGSSNLSFVTSSCEISDTAGNKMSVTYQNGSITDNLLVTPAELSGIVWYDANGNGIKDPGETGMRWGVWIDLFTGSGIWKKGMLTDTAGYFKFDSLSPGNYYVVPYLIGGYSGYRFTTAFVGTDSAINSHVQQVTDSTGKSNVVALVSGEDYSDMNIGTVQKVTAIEPGLGTNGSDNSIPKSFVLSQNYPNPFNPSTVIRFGLPDQEKVTLMIYNILGERVATLLDAELSAGYHTVTFDASNLASGIYIYQLRGFNVNITKKMMLTK